VSAQGVDGAGVTAIAEGELSALASILDCRDTDSWAAVEPRLLAARACQHDAVIQAAFARTAVLPVRFGSFARDAQATRDYLRRSSAQLLAGLQAVEGIEEWGAELVLTSHADDTKAASGADYLRARSNKLRRAGSMDGPVLEAVECLGRRAEAHAVEKASSSEKGGARAKCVFLVHRGNRDSFVRAADEIGKRAGDISIDLKGPWPPYRFDLLGVEVTCIGS
jgi:hypothetical protein